MCVHARLFNSRFSFLCIDISYEVCRTFERVLHHSPPDESPFAVLRVPLSDYRGKVGSMYSAIVACRIMVSVPKTTRRRSMVLELLRSQSRES